MITETSFFGLPLRTPAQRRLLVILYYTALLLLTSLSFTRNRRLPEAMGVQTFIFAGLLGVSAPVGP